MPRCSMIRTLTGSGSAKRCSNCRPTAGPTNDFLDATAARYLQVGEVQSPDGSIVFDNEWRPRIEYAGYPKDISNWRILILHRVP